MTDTFVINGNVFACKSTRLLRDLLDEHITVVNITKTVDGILIFWILMKVELIPIIERHLNKQVIWNKFQYNIKDC